MPTSPAELPDARETAGTLLLFADEQGEIGSWLIEEEGRVTVRGVLPDWPVAARTLVSVPGTQVAIHWLTLADTLSPAQAAAAARLMLADASAEPLDSLHLAVGVAEEGRTPVALVPRARMEQWIGGIESRGYELDGLVPSPMLMAPPVTGFAARDIDGTTDYRALGAAFRLEPELAASLLGEAPAERLDESDYEAVLPALLAAPPLNLRQGAFAKRRRTRVVEGSWRRLALYALALGALTLMIQVAAILSYTFAADRLENQIASRGQSGAPARAAGFGPVASLLFEAIRSTPNAELTRLDWRADGSLAASLRVDTPATLAALRARAEASGLRVEGNPAPNAGAAELVVRL